MTIRLPFLVIVVLIRWISVLRCVTSVVTFLTLFAARKATANARKATSTSAAVTKRYRLRICAFVGVGVATHSNWLMAESTSEAGRNPPKLDSMISRIGLASMS
jgi:hypothetical protein